ncbi:DUF3081 domain-containing protein [Shewanella sp. GutCb]|uniref:DUF3081 family protein n=1 Tax=Shewanella sp. GutCb TaxID=2058315 RepID=UPI000C79806B|nr:DUF3081 family protein [Shewanella sp. GutCb]PKG76634.1 DUF3081 domain-containing protein [Shewanella sp. GutCb]
MSLSQHLFVFNHVLSKGKKHDDKYHLDGLTAWHDIDGYTCYLGYRDLVMTLMFHGRFSYEYQDRIVYNDFNSLVTGIFRRLSSNSIVG